VDAQICAACGTRFKTSRDRCPKCRTRVAVVDPAAVAASSRRLARIAMVSGAIALMGISAVWLRAPKAESSPVVPATVDPLAARRSASPPATPEAGRASTERPFMDPAGAAHESYSAGDFESALKHYQEAVGRNPRDAEALSNLGQVLVRLGRVREALPYFNQAIELNPDRWAYTFNRARAEGLLGQWRECITDYRRAQELFPNDYATIYNLALALHQSGDDEAAVKEYQRAIELAPQDGTFRRALGISLERLHRPADAAAAYGEYLKLSPEAEDADKVKQRIALLTSSDRTTVER